MTDFDKLKEDFTHYLESNRYRKTPERYAILRKIDAQEHLFSVYSLHSLMQAEFPVSLATIYNTLNMLVDCKLIIRHKFEEQIVMYEKKTSDVIMSNYTVCNECGKTTKFTDNNISKSVEKKIFAKFEPSHYSLYVFGLCNKCKQKKLPTKK
ncbi:MAG: transcriptional repressor [Paludibacter sp.]|jgi:Fur family ferric uptake transcriptional regulator|nr:transcriptional repressor [Paludibacter sp.]